MKRIRLTESDIHNIIKETITNFQNWFKGSKTVDNNGKPLILYHASDNTGGSYNADMVFYTTDEEYAQEFGNNIDKGFLKLIHPYITQDGILINKDNQPITDEDGFQMTTGYLDALDDDDLNYFMTNYDGVISENGYMVVSFIHDNFYKI